MTTQRFMLLRRRRASAGVALVTAIFLLVVLAGLAVAVVSLTTAQQTASVMDQQGQRAYQAARAGNEWALYIALRTGPAVPTPAATLICPGTYAVPMPAGSLSSFTVTVACAAAVDGHITITSTACNQPDQNGLCPNPTRGADYVQRVITSQL
jgi:MSHA biogenesis protein MshP